MIEVVCLDSRQKLWFSAKTPYQAMEKLIYYLDSQRKDKDAKIALVGGGRVLTVLHSGRTWSTLNK